MSMITTVQKEIMVIFSSHKSRFRQWHDSLGVQVHHLPPAIFFVLSTILWYADIMSRLQLLKKNREKILTLAEKRGACNVRVFGSVARGEENETSDVDFLMTFRKGTTLFDRGGLVSDLREFLGCDVDVVSDKTVHSLVRDEVYHSAVAL